MKQIIILIFLDIFLFEFQFGKIGICQDTNFRFEQLKTEDGLSNGTITDIFQDSKGFIWFATSNGLNCYDSYQFYVYNNIQGDTRSISNNNIEVIREDSYDNIWVGTDNGLNLFVREQNNFINYFFDSCSRINGIVDDANYLWISTHTGGVYRMNRQNNKLDHYQHDKTKPNSLASNNIFRIYKDSKNRIWISILEQGLSLYNPNTDEFESYMFNSNNLSINTIWCFYEISETEFLLGTGDGMVRFFPEKKEIIHYKHDFKNNTSISKGHVNKIFKDKSGNLWIASQYGLNIFNEKQETFTHIKSDPNDQFSINTDEIWDIEEDNQGILWFGTYKNGINKLNPGYKYFKHWSYNPLDKRTLMNKSVLSFVENKDCTLWLAIDHGGLSLFDRNKGTLKNYIHNPNNENSIQNNNIVSLLLDSKKQLWLGAWGGGLSKFDKANNKFIKYEPLNIYTKNWNIFDLLEDSKGRIWIASFDYGLSCYDTKTQKLKTYRADKNDTCSLSSDIVWTLFEDSQNNLWIGTAVGLNKYNETNDNFEYFKYIDDNVSEANFYETFSIYEDTHQRLWIGTGDYGLLLFNKENKTFKACNINDGLPNNIVFGILEDDSSNLWISTVNTISKIEVDADGKITKIHNFDKKNGIKGDQFNLGAAFKSMTGELFFGGNDGFIFFNPDSIKSNTYKPKIFITELKIFNKKVPIDPSGKTSSPLRKHITETKEITLTYEQSVFSLKYVALNYITSEKNQYAYKLEGFEDSWNYVKNKRDVTYTNLDPGKYIFKVKGSNNDGLWNKEPTMITIYILPPWWETWWFRTFGVIFIIGALVFIFIYRVRVINRRNKRLKKIVLDRTRDVVNQKERIMDKNIDLQRQKLEIEEKNSALNQQKEELRLQKEELQLTLNNLKSTQSQLIQAEKMASLGQLIAGIAHEINTPLGAIKASVGTILIESDNSFQSLPQLLNKLPLDLLELFFEFVNKGKQIKISVTSREERKQRLELEKILISKGIKDADSISDKLARLCIVNEIDKYLPLLNNEYSLLIINTAYSLLEQRKNSLNIQEAVKRVSKIVFALKNFSQQKTSNIKTKVNISESIDNVLTLYYNQFKHGIKVIKQFEEIPKLSCYPDELNQVWSNIIHNALYAMDNNGELTISTCLINNNIEIRIIDTGIGMSYEVKEHIFEPFYTTKPLGEGSGLGLDIVKKIITKHNGTIEVDSVEDIGTELIITLPIN